MIPSFFVSDLHGHTDRFEKLFRIIAAEKPKAIFIGGDLLPSGLASRFSMNFSHRDFINGYLVKRFSKLRQKMKDSYPEIFIILGNDDGRFEEAAILDAAARGVWEYIHNRKKQFLDFSIYGYSYIPPSPFLLKDWERYDVSRYVDPGCVSPEDGILTRPVSQEERKNATILKDLNRLAGEEDLKNAIFLFHAPPYGTNLDRAALDNQKIDHVPLDVHVGSVAMMRFIRSRQPLITLHGHIHESARLTGSWKDRIGRTSAFTGAHDGPELSLIRMDLESPDCTSRELL